MDEICTVDLAPARCERHGYLHRCDETDGHTWPHVCACGHRWTESDDA